MKDLIATGAGVFGESERRMYCRELGINVPISYQFEGNEFKKSPYKFECQYAKIVDNKILCRMKGFNGCPIFEKLERTQDSLDIAELVMELEKEYGEIDESMNRVEEIEEKSDGDEKVK